MEIQRSVLLLSSPVGRRMWKSSFFTLIYPYTDRLFYLMLRDVASNVIAAIFKSIKNDFFFYSLNLFTWNPRYIPLGFLSYRTIYSVVIWKKFKLKYKYSKYLCIFSNYVYLLQLIKINKVFFILVGSYSNWGNIHFDSILLLGNNHYSIHHYYKDNVQILLNNNN